MKILNGGAAPTPPPRTITWGVGLRSGSGGLTKWQWWAYEVAVVGLRSGSGGLTKCLQSGQQRPQILFLVL
jgi:hypothetical protein